MVKSTGALHGMRMERKRFDLKFSLELEIGSDFDTILRNKSILFGSKTNFPSSFFLQIYGAGS